MNPTKNDVTGDFLITGAASDKYREGWDRIFGKKDKEPVKEEPKKEQDVQHKPRRQKKD